MTSEIVYSPTAVSFVGRDAVELYRARTLAAALRLYAKTGMLPARHINLLSLLLLAQNYTGKTYKRSKAQAAQAADDVKVWADAFALSLPHRTEAE
jgi:hypothetical protein